MANFFTDGREGQEWNYLFKNAIDWDRILPLYYPSFPTPDGSKNKEELLSFFSDLLTATGEWAADTLAPRARELDRIGGGTLNPDGTVTLSEPLQKTMREAAEMELFGMCVEPRFGGMGVPISVGLVGFTQIPRACFSTSGAIAFFTTIADMIERFGTKEWAEHFIPRICRGEISGSMCLTEPGAGSDVGSLRTSAEKQGDGTYLLNGTKMFITNAGGGLAFILARVKGAPAGLEGISMFFAEQFPGGRKEGAKPNFRIAKIEEKMGMHGSVTCEVVYENTVAHLVGKEGEGFKIMLHLMNEARISVGMQGVGGVEAALSEARKYAETRVQFGKPIIELPLLRRHFEDWETERDAFRAFMVDTVSHYDIFQRLDLKKRHTGDLSEEENKIFRRSQKVCRFRTPLAKFHGAEMNALITQRAVQVFGGYGFMTEYPVERLHRDSFGALLYEGTSQIQALMAMKDFIKALIRDPARFVQSLVASHPVTALLSGSEFERGAQGVAYEFRKNIAALLIRCFRPELSVSENGFRDVLSQITSVFSQNYWQEEGRFDKLMIHAETLAQALTYLETLKVLARHATADPARGDLFRRYQKLVTPRFAAIYADWRG